jgi:hypothetical protein
MTNICRTSNLKSLVKMPSAPPEVKHISSILEEDQSRYNHSHTKPILAEEDKYQSFVQYLRRSKPTINWIHKNESSSVSNSNNSFCVSPWWIYHQTVHWKNKTFTTYNKNPANSIISYHQNNVSNFGKIVNIFTVNDPYQKITECFLVINPFEINKDFMTDWPHLNM